MKLYYFVFKFVLYTFIFLGISNSSYSKILDFNQDAKNVSSYFSGTISFNDFDYSGAEKFFDNLDDSENANEKFSSMFIQSLLNLEKYNEAYFYSKNLEKKKLSNFESNLVQGLFEFKNKNYTKAKSYFDKLEPTFENQLIFNPLKTSLIIWSDISNSNNRQTIDLIKSMSSDYGSFKFVQEVFAHCYFDTPDTEKEFTKIIKNERDRFYRYNFFFANYLFEKNSNNSSVCSCCSYSFSISIKNSN